jgi:hypothetical protein
MKKLNHSAKKSTNRKATPLQSGTRMLNFQLNRAIKNLPKIGKKILELLKEELRILFGDTN